MKRKEKIIKLINKARSLDELRKLFDTYKMDILYDNTLSQIYYDTVKKISIVTSCIESWDVHCYPN